MALEAFFLRLNLANFFDFELHNNAILVPR